MKLRIVSLLLIVLVGCTTDEPVTSIFALPQAGGAFFDLPWPNDLRRTSDGRVDLTDFPNPGGQKVLDDYKAAMADLTGYSVSAATYFKFDGPLDESSLPSAEESIAADSPVVLMDVDANGEIGTRHPVVSYFWSPQTKFWPGDTLAVRPVHGLPLAANRTYALAILNTVQSATGLPVQSSVEFEKVKAGTSDAALMSVYQPALDVLAANGVDKASIVTMTVFTTQDLVGEMQRARDWLMSDGPVPNPVEDDWTYVTDDADMVIVQGSYNAPNFQSGALPYQTVGGNIEFSEGIPVLQSEFNARFRMAIPKTTMPEAGYPIVLYAHGTGGDYNSFLNVGLTRKLAKRGIATMGIDQLHHGPRNPSTSTPEVLTFNVVNPQSLRDNARQGALDVVQQARFVTMHPVSEFLVFPQVKFDPDNILFFGHSQGGINGPIFLAIDDHVKASVLSGAGGVISIGLVDKTEPFEIASIVRLAIGAGGDENLVYEHPIISLVQTWMDVADPAHYVDAIFQNPREGFAPKSVFQTQGTEDAFTPPRSMEALSSAAGIPLLQPVLAPIPAHSILGIEPVSGAAQGNVAGGAATAGLLQIDGGHFVAFEDSIEDRAVNFLVSATQGVPVIQ